MNHFLKIPGPLQSAIPTPLHRPSARKPIFWVKAGVCLLACLHPGGLQAAAGSFRETISPPAQPWNLQKAVSSEIPPIPGGWAPMESFRSLINPATGRPDGDNIWYQTNLKIPAGASERSVWLRFQHIRGIARLYLNGKFVKELVRPDWEADISNHVTPGGTAELWVYVTRTGEGTDAKFDEDLIMPTVMKKAYNTRYPANLGLMGKVELQLRGQSSWLSGAWVQSIWEPKGLKVHVQTGGQAGAGLQVAGDIQDASGKSVLKLTPVPFDPAGVEISTPWKDVVPWELGQGVLYKLNLRLIAGQAKGVLDQLPPITFGFREVRVEGRHIILNGTRSHWRLSPIIWFDVLRKSGNNHEEGSLRTIDFLSQVGFNVLEVQPHMELFWANTSGPWPVYDEKLLGEADQKGIGLTIGALQFTHHFVDYGISSDPGVRAQYRRELTTFLAEYRNHPSILAWVGAMNFFDVRYGALANAPWGMGREPAPGQKNSPTYQAIAQGGRLIESVDPTRPAFSHHGSNAGTIASSNQHMCMTPVAELERWPSDWAKNGEKPWIAVEFAIPYWADFWMKNRNEQSGNLDPLGEAAITEFSAMTIGDKAYEDESESLRKKLPSLTKENIHGHGSETVPPSPALRVDGNILDLPAVREVFSEYGERVHRAWRTWEVTGWSPWLLSWGLRYRGNPEIFMPDVVEAFKKANQPLLAYIGGAPEFYLRQWNYSSTETINKTAVFVWDGPGPHKLRAKWEAVLGDKVVDKGEIEQTLAPNTVTKIPITFPAPKASEKTPLSLRLTVTSKDGPGTSDEQMLAIWPPPKPAAPLQRELVLFDPANESPWVAARFPNLKTAKESNLAALDPAKSLLVLGRHSLQGLAKLPYSGEQVGNGLKVIVLEQSQADLLRLGLRSVERGTREGFAVAKSSLVFEGLSERDFRDWRGSASLLSETENFRWWTDLDKLDPFNPARGARWGTHGNVCSVQIESPQKGNFVPLIRCGFDMAYGPLLQWTHGNGAVWFCQLDLTGRVGSDPAATRLADNLIQFAAGSHAPANRSLLLEGIPEPQAAGLTGLGFRMAPELSPQALRLTQAPLPEDVSGFEVAGEKSVPEPPDREWESVTHIAADQIRMPDRSIPPPNLLRFRIPVEVQKRPCDQALLGLSETPELIQGYIGVPLLAADGPYVGQTEKDHARLSRWRIRQLYAWMFSMAGGESSPEVVERITTLMALPVKGGMDEKIADLLPLRDVKVSQALQIDGFVEASLLNAPNLPELKLTDQKTLSANKDAFSYGGEDATGGYVDLAKLLGVPPSSKTMAVMTAQVQVTEEQELTVRIGADFWGTVTLNGEKILSLDAPVGTPKRDAARVRAKFKGGDNQLVVRVVSGSLGFGVWLDVDNDPTMTPIRVKNIVGVEPFWGSAMLPYDGLGFSLYTEPMRKRDDPCSWKSW